MATAPDNCVYVTGRTLSFGAGDSDAFLLSTPHTGASSGNGPGGIVMTPAGSETFAGGTEAVFLRLQR